MPRVAIQATGTDVPLAVTSIPADVDRENPARTLYVEDVGEAVIKQASLCSAGLFFKHAGQMITKGVHVGENVSCRQLSADLRVVGVANQCEHG